MESDCTEYYSRKNLGGTPVSISLDILTEQAEKTGYRLEMLEKTLRLMLLLTSLTEQTFLKEKLVLKGGTALNLFYFGLPRLSIDIDLNYIGSIHREEMLIQRKQIETILSHLFQREGYTIRRNPTEHAGGKIALRYNSAVGQTAQLEVDLNYMLRVPLWPIERKDSILIHTYQAKAVPTLNIHELMAGKLAALFSRHASRDLFDTYYFFTHFKHLIDKENLRCAFIIYGAINRLDWRILSIDHIHFTEQELKNQLIPVLSRHFQSSNSLPNWVKKAVIECHEAISDYLLPLKKHEIEFLNQINDYGEICADLLTDNEELIQKMKVHPGLQWKAHNAKLKGIPPIK